MRYVGSLLMFMRFTSENPTTGTLSKAAEVMIVSHDYEIIIQ